jgi:hypothetical protein
LVVGRHRRRQAAAAVKTRHRHRVRVAGFLPCSLRSEPCGFYQTDARVKRRGDRTAAQIRRPRAKEPGRSCLQGATNAGRPLPSWATRRTGRTHSDANAQRAPSASTSVAFAADKVAMPAAGPVRQAMSCQLIGSNTTSTSALQLPHPHLPHGLAG